MIFEKKASEKKTIKAFIKVQEQINEMRSRILLLEKKVKK